MAIVDRPRRVLLRALRPCADVEDILSNKLHSFTRPIVRWIAVRLLRRLRWQWTRATKATRSYI